MTENDGTGTDLERTLREAMAADDTEHAHVERELRELRQRRPLVWGPPVVYSTVGACTGSEAQDALVR